MSGEDQEVKASIIGGAVGMLLGIGGGCGCALILNTYTNGMAWFVIPHVTVAMVLMGLWLTPCLLVHSSDESEDSVNSPESVQLVSTTKAKVSSDTHTAA